MHQLCVVEDVIEVSNAIHLVLSDWYGIHAVASLAAAKKLLSEQKIHLILLDINLPDGNGFEFCASLKSDPHTKDIPVIFLTDKAAPVDKMMGFSIGAADYLGKPFEPIELRARIEARLKKDDEGTSVDAPDRVIGSLRFDTARHRAYEARGERRDLNLTPFEFKLMYFLASHPGEIFSRANLLKHLIDPNVHVDDKTVYTHISSVRKKLGELSVCLESLPRVGYRFNASE